MEQAAVGRSDSNDKHIDIDVVAQSRASNPPQYRLQNSEKEAAKQYSRTKLLLGVLGTALFFVLSGVLVISGLSRSVEHFSRALVSNDYLALLLFALSLGTIEMILTSPLSFYSGYYLEHKYRLSNQTIGAWMWEGMKGLLVGIPITTPILIAFYYCLKNFGTMWWLPVASLLFFVSVILARLAPILIFPLFYKFRPLEENALRKRILSLCEKVGFRVEGIYSFDMSKNTKKANAAFTGIGKSRRIILGDTLVANFTDEEIEVVFAHELGHYKLRHIWTMMAVGTASSFLGLFCTALLYQTSLRWFGFSRVDELAALPLLTLWLGAYSLITSPLGNMVSRAHERAADKYAIGLTHDKESFANAMRKLASINLADTAPPPLVEFFFYSHPSIEKRIQAVERL